MKLSKILLTAAAPIAALSLGTVLLTPGTSEGYSLIGGQLSQSQRDFRIFNNFTDSDANNNQTPDDQFPGAQGAVMAIWKASVEWGSELHGDGTGDPHQNGSLGSGGANFDVSFQGEATAVGGTNDNIHSELTGSSGGVLAFTETPISDGWRIRYYSGWTWNDGPGTNISGVDLQGVACHEYGHALGLGHSTSGSATMAPSISGSGVSARSISTDDSNGVKAIYGAKSATKPRITGVSVASGVITVTGSNFDPTGNQIWFTQSGSGGDGTPIKVTGLNSANGTTLTATIPSTAGPGDVLVRSNSTANSGLSNSWPTDFAGGSTGGGGAPSVTAVSPATVDAVTPDGQTITLTGQGFTGTTSVVVDGITLSSGLPSEYSIVNDNTLTFKLPLLSKLGIVDISLTNPSGTGATTIDVVANSTPVVDLSNSDPAFIIQGVGVDITVAGQPGDIAIIGVSKDLIPTPLPGLIDQPLAIGNNFTTLIQLGNPIVGPAGYKTIHIALQGIPTGTQFFLQTATLSLSNFYAFPARVSNVQSGTILF